MHTFWQGPFSSCIQSQGKHLGGRAKKGGGPLNGSALAVTNTSAAVAKKMVEWLIPDGDMAESAVACLSLHPQLRDLEARLLQEREEKAVLAGEPNFSCH